MAQEQVQLEFREQMQADDVDATTGTNESTSATTATNDDKSDRSKKSSVDCRDDRGIYEGREENYVTI